MKVLFQQVEQNHCMIPCYGTHDSRKEINNKSIQGEYKIWVLVTEAYGYLVQFRPYQGAKKGKQVASSTKWVLVENVALRLMQCFTPAFSLDTFIDNYFTSFRLLTQLGVTNIRVAGVVNKNSLRKPTIIGDKQLQKKGT